jgi:gluconate 5-dehydrogenase
VGDPVFSLSGRSAAYALSQAVALRLASCGRSGRIVNVSSVVGQLGRAGDVAYAAAKAGLDGLTRALAADLGRQRPAPPEPG